MIRLTISSTRSIGTLPLLTAAVKLPPKKECAVSVKAMPPGISMSSPARMGPTPACVAPQSDITWRVLALTMYLGFKTSPYRSPGNSVPL
jgi:hypothetical protein